MRVTSKPAVWLALLAVGLTLTLAACASTSTPTPPATGTLKITVSGVPSGASGGKVVVSGPGSYTKTITATTTLSGLAVGTYTLAPETISNGTYPWDAPSSTVDVTAGATISGTVTYTEDGGAISLGFIGPLPAGTSYSATISGNGVTRHVTAGYNSASLVTITVPNLPDGSYSVTAPTLHGCASHIAETYTPTPVPNPVPITNNVTTPDLITYLPGLPGIC